MTTKSLSIIHQLKHMVAIRWNSWNYDANLVSSILQENTDHHSQDVSKVLSVIADDTEECIQSSIQGYIADLEKYHPCDKHYQQGDIEKVYGEYRVSVARPYNKSGKGWITKKGNHWSCGCEVKND